jgi:hypothetical protein
MSNTAKIIDAIAEGNLPQADEAFLKAVKEKVNTVLDIKRVAITSDIYNRDTK